MGAWIETRIEIASDPAKLVAPYMGAWIETTMCRLLNGQTESLPIWERGLKQISKMEDGDKFTVAPYMGAWIETINESKIG